MSALDLEQAPVRPPRVAVIGVGLAGATCARRLGEAGCAVMLFDKSRGVGGRMATRRAEWIDADGALHRAVFDHGAPAFCARSAAFCDFVEQAAAAGVVSRWKPVMAPGSHSNLDGLALWVATPDMPALCGWQAAGLPLLLSSPVESLVRDDAGGGWRLLGEDGLLGGGAFDAVVLALTPAQAAELLEPHHPDWARQALHVPMQPCWTLMAAEAGAPPAWDAAWPERGPLAWIIRNATKPGRPPDTGLTTWVVHATAAWSRTYLDSPPEQVQAALQSALAQALGRNPRWAHAAVNRWRYALAPRTEAAHARCWWDPALRLGACGDYFGGAGVEGAWLSGRALAAAIVPAAAGAAPGLNAGRA